MVSHGGHSCGHHWRLGRIGSRGCVERKPAARGRYVVNLFHVDFEMIGPLKHLAALAARMRTKPALVLMPDVTEESALQVEASAAGRTSVLDAVRGLAHGVHGVLFCAVQTFQPHRLCGSFGGGRSSGPSG